METNTENNTHSPSRFVVTDDDLKKQREIPRLPNGWTVGMVTGVSLVDANSGKWGLRLTHIPLPSMDSPISAGKRAYKTFNTLWAWMKDPKDPKRKAGKTFGLWESFVRAHGVQKPSDGSSCPPTARRDKDSDRLVGPDGEVTRAQADAMRLAADRWMNETYIEMVVAAEEKARPHPLEKYMAYMKIVQSEPDATGKSYQNIAAFRETLPDDAVLMDLSKIGKDDDSDDSDE